MAIPLSLMLWGCSNEKAPDAGQPKPKRPWESATVVLPFTSKVIETQETKATRETEALARELFTAKDYEKLEELAARFRASKEITVNGSWMLTYVYSGISLSETASEAAWKGHLDALRAWVKTRPESITARVALADELTNYAWKARGGGYADAVTREGWKLFEERQAEAEKILKSAESLKETCPKGWSVRLMVARGRGMDRADFDRLFRRAIEAEPRYIRHYYSKAIYLLPRWHGEEGEVAAMLTKSADLIGGDDGDLFYARVAWQLNDSELFANVFRECKLSWPRVEKGLAIMARSYPDSLAVKHARVLFMAQGAANKQILPTVRKLLKDLDGQVDLSVWRTKERFDDFAKWAYSQ